MMMWQRLLRRYRPLNDSKSVGISPKDDLSGASPDDHSQYIKMDTQTDLTSERKGHERRKV